jgi:hypothetical protein
MRIILFSLILLLTNASHASQSYGSGFLKNIHLPHKVTEQIFGYLAPNERYPATAAPVFENAPLGVYVTVGTERGFMSASLTPKATHLVLIDIDPEVILFDRINTLLLKISENREDYLNLRLTDSQTIWIERAKALNFDPESILLLGSPETEKFWNTHIRSFEFKEFYIDPRTSPTLMFKNANYLFYDERYWVISKLAKEDKIATLLIDLSDGANVEALAQYLQDLGLHLSLFDMSNLIERYLPQPAFAQIVHSFEQISDERSIVMVVGHLFKGWAHYVGATYKQISTLEANPKIGKISFLVIEQYGEFRSQ